MGRSVGIDGVRTEQATHPGTDGCGDAGDGVHGAPRGDALLHDDDPLEARGPGGCRRVDLLRREADELLFRHVSP